MILTRTKSELREEVNNFLATDFATDFSQWSEYILKFALPFIRSFLDNLDFINEISKNSESTIEKEDVLQNKIIFQFIDLYKMIKIDPKKKKTFVNIETIDKSFFELKNKKEIDVINESILELDKINQKESQTNRSLKKLYKDMNLLIQYIKDVEYRKYFYRKVLIKENFVYEKNNKLIYQIKNFNS